MNDLLVLGGRFCLLKNNLSNCKWLTLCSCGLLGNQIMVVAFQPVQLAKASFLQKNQTLQNVFFDICNAEMAQSFSSLQKSEFLSWLFHSSITFWCQNQEQWHKMSGKNTNIHISYCWFKNKRVWAEKIGKKRKNSKT